MSIYREMIVHTCSFDLTHVHVFKWFFCRLCLRVGMAWLILHVRPHAENSLSMHRDTGSFDGGWCTAPGLGFVNSAIFSW